MGTAVRERGGGEGGEEAVRKGPWKAEEDEVLLCHVNRYGPRDWSSIRSKGLLRRTGKSCRLRWVNKLRPNLKSGVKFSAEEERVVIELQGQLGNKWARIAQYLPGRTDNDVKNFWSSRQKRLARILQNPQAPQKGRAGEPPALSPNLHILQGPGFCHSAMEEPSSKLHSCLSPSSMGQTHPGLISMLAAPDQACPHLLIFDAPHMKALGLPEDPLSFSSLNQEVAATLEDPNFLEVFAPIGLPSPGNGAFLGLDGSSRKGASDGGPMTPDSFFDDFPTDMFDNI